MPTRKNSAGERRGAQRGMCPARCGRTEMRRGRTGLRERQEYRSSRQRGHLRSQGERNGALGVGGWRLPRLDPAARGGMQRLIALRSSLQMTAVGVGAVSECARLQTANGDRSHRREQGKTEKYQPRCKNAPQSHVNVISRGEDRGPFGCAWSPGTGRCADSARWAAGPARRPPNRSPGDRRAFRGCWS